MSRLQMGTNQEMETLDREDLLAGIIDALTKVNQKLDCLVDVNERILQVSKEILCKVTDGASGSKAELSRDPDTMSLLSLPMALRKTIMVLYRLERGTADDLAKETGRLRAVESAAANQLVRMGYLKKCREGRDVYFYIESSEENRQ